MDSFEVHNTAYTYCKMQLETQQSLLRITLAFCRNELFVLFNFFSNSTLVGSAYDQFK